jgi:hypothetical protein
MKIKDYAQVSGPISLSDKLIGTEVGGVVPFATKNFTLQQLLDLFIQNLPPNMSNDDILSIASPTLGLTIYNTTLNTLCYYSSTEGWRSVTSEPM